MQNTGKHRLSSKVAVRAHKGKFVLLSAASLCTPTTAEAEIEFDPEVGCVEPGKELSVPVPFLEADPPALTLRTDVTMPTPLPAADPECSPL
jgi:hypothetical protein